MTLVEGIRALRQERADLMIRLTAIDRELAEVRELLGGDVRADEAAIVAPPVAASAPAFDVRKCERCDGLFTPAAGVSGRWCSRRCYEGLSVDDRRELIFTAVREHGPIFPSRLKALPALREVSGSTLNNDLYRLSHDGRVKNTEEGWQVVTAPAESEGADETRPLASRQNPTVDSPTSSARW